MRDEDGDVHPVTNPTKGQLKDMPERKERSSPTNIAELATGCSEGQK
jgi:hypothetical protein